MANNWFTKAFRSILTTGLSLASPQSAILFNSWLGGRETIEPVTPQTAQTLSAFYQGIGIHCRAISMLPFSIYKDRRGGGKRELTTHALYPLLKFGPHPEYDTYQWRQDMVQHKHLRGNTYAFKLLSGNGITGLVPLHPDRVMPYRNIANAELRYKVADFKGGWQDVPRDWILHVRNRTEDGVIGMSTIQMARFDVDRQIQMQKYNQHVFKNQAKPSGMLEHPGRLDETGAKRLRESFEELYSGASNGGRPILLEDGLTFKPVSVNPDDAQWVESYGAGVDDVSRWLNLPKHMLGSTQGVNFSNMEQMALEFMQLTVLPEVTMWEAAMNWQLLTAAEREQGITIKLDLKAFMRGDTATRFMSYAVGRQWGFYCADDIREMEDMDPLPNGAGQIFLQPVNMEDAEKANDPDDPSNQPPVQTIPASPVAKPALGDAPGAAPVNTNPGTTPAAKKGARMLIDHDAGEPGALLKRQKSAFKRVFEQHARSLFTKESKFLESLERRASGLAAGEELKQIDDFYAKHVDLYASVMLPPLLAFAEAVSDDQASEYAPKISERMKAVGEAVCAESRQHTIRLSFPFDRVSEIADEYLNFALNTMGIEQ